MNFRYFGKKKLAKTLSMLLTVCVLSSSFGLTASQAQTTTANNSARRPTLIPNSQPYTAAGMTSATGRAGSATITVRALMGKDNSTDLEVTTGQLDSTTPAPGRLTKVQLKSLNKSGQIVYTRNFNGLNGGGFFKTALTDVLLGMPLQIQSNVTGIDPNRTGVVTIQEKVKLRPDLEASNLAVAKKAVLNTTVNISATIRELNGDVGAKAKCVLYVDNQAVDSAQGITVGAGDTVSCAFAQTFSSTGTKQLKVSVEGVTPGDYDTANNSVTGQVEIIQLAQAQASYTASVSEITLYDRRYIYTAYYSTRYLYSTDYASEEWGGEKGYVHKNQQSVRMTSWVEQAVSFPVNLSMKETSANGTIVKSITVNDVTAHSEWSGDFYGCGQVNIKTAWLEKDGAQINYLVITRIGDVPNNNCSLPATRYYSTMEYNRYQGKVTYYSNSFLRQWSSDGYEWSYSNNKDVEYGTEPPSFGGQATLEASFGTVGNSTTYVAKPVITLTPYNYDDSIPLSCSEYSYSYEDYIYDSQSCKEYIMRYISGYGSAEQY